MYWKLFLGQPRFNGMMDADLGTGGGGSGVEVDPAAGGQSTVDTGEGTGGTPAGTPAGVEVDPAAGGQTEDQFDERTESAFAKRLEAKLAAERAAWEQQSTVQLQEAQAQVFQQLDPLLKLAQTEAARYGMTPLQWAQQVQANRAQNYQQMVAERAEEMGVDPQFIMDLLDQHPDVIEGRQLKSTTAKQAQEAQAKQKFTNEANALFKAYPDLDPATIPVEVIEARNKEGIPLLDAYNRIVFPKKLQEMQNGLGVQKQNEANANNTPGGIGSNGAPQSGYYTEAQVKKMSQAEVDANYDAIMASMPKWKK